MSIFQVDACKGRVLRNSPTSITIEGQITMPTATSKLHFLAAAPPDFRESYSGSGLPFASPKMAFDNTPNHGEMDIDSRGNFSITMMTPNSYYTGHGTVLVPPIVYVTYTETTGKTRTVSIKVDDSIPYRTLTYPNSRTSASFYDIDLPIRSQEQILRDAAYPCETMHVPENHWGLKPPM